jgi:hypothetical protein
MIVGGIMLPQDTSHMLPLCIAVYGSSARGSVRTLPCAQSSVRGSVRQYVAVCGSAHSSARGSVQLCAWQCVAVWAVVCGSACGSVYAVVCGSTSLRESCAVRVVVCGSTLGSVWVVWQFGSVGQCISAWQCALSGAAVRTAECVSDVWQCACSIWQCSR